MSETTVVIDPADVWRPESAVVHGTLPSGREVRIDAIGPRSKFGVPAGPEVNWPGIGAVAPSDAAAFAALLLEAVDVAGRLLPAGPPT